MKIIYSLFIFLLLNINLGFSGPKPLAQCSPFSSKILSRTITTCIQRSRPDLPPLPGEPVVYFMHGAQGNARMWEKNGYDRALDSLRNKKNLPPVTFISFDTEAMSFFTDHQGKTSGPTAYETFFIHELIPEFEKNLNLCQIRECRGVIGFSMGGLGAIKTALRFPELFSVVAANAPALPPFNVFESNFRWMAYFGKHPVGPLIAMPLIFKAREIMQNREIADQHDPSWIIQNRSFYQFPALFINVGDQDYFGFQEGYHRFTALMSDRKIPWDGEIVPNGGHELPNPELQKLLDFTIEKLY